ncbi:MAG: serine/threonine protein kinase [Gemmatimonadaceae bacterium]|nr:serine/threonine protein kinase [Gemmatimonadaceae bacterium]
MDAELLALQQVVAGRISILREVGRGGMGIVVLARDLQLDRPVALKLLPAALARRPEARRAFVREARAAAALAHPNIVAVHSVEEHGEIVFFTMAFVDGETLGARVRRAGAVSPEEGLRIVQDVAWALGHAHARGVIHRDVKPDNILLDRESGRAMVTDFGIARLEASDTPADGTTRGTAQYLSPEQARGDAGDARSDVYALGVTSWVVLTGRLPFASDSVAGYLVAHAEQPAPSIGGAVALPVDLAAAIDRCLAKRPEDRWESMEAFASALERSRAPLRRVPAAVTTFVQEWNSIGSEVATFGAATGAGLLLAGAMGALPGDGFSAAIFQAIYLLIATIAGSVALARLFGLSLHARRLLAAGHDLDAAVRALRASDQLHGERGSATGWDRGTVALLAGGVALTGAGVALTLTASTDLSFLGAVKAMGAATVTLRVLLTRRGTAEGWWARALRGRLGRGVFAVARLFSRTPIREDINAPTEVLLGHEAEAQFRALPAAQREAFADAPAVIARLRDAAVLLREDPSPVAAARLATVLGTLETLRLDLVRARHAASPSELTAALDRAREIGQTVDALVSLSDP